MLILEKYASICSFCSNFYKQNWKDLTIRQLFVCLEKKKPKKADFVLKKVTSGCIKNSVYLLNFFHKYISGESSAKFSKEAYLDKKTILSSCKFESVSWNPFHDCIS